MGAVLLSDLVRKAAAGDPDRPLIVAADRTRTAARLAANAAAVAEALRRRQLPPRTRCAVLSRNRTEFFELLFGAADAGCVLVSLNWRLRLDELAAIVADAEPAILVVSEEYAELGAELVERQRRRGGELALAIIDDAWPAGLAAGAGPSITGDQPAPGEDGVVLQLYTSGTTGLPKGVMIAGEALEFMLARVNESWDFGPDTIALVPMPLFHIGGIGWSLAALAGGGRLVLQDAPRPDAMLEAIATEGVTDIMVVPAQLGPLCDAMDAAPRPLPRLRRIVYAASPISRQLLVRTMGTFGVAMAQIYGQTECLGPVCQLLPEDHGDSLPNDDDALPQLASCGKPVAWTELRLVDPATGVDVEPGAPGEIWTRSPQNMRGYWRQPQRTAETITADGWLRTGDVAVERDGYIYLVDRLSAMIISGGENVYPAEVERVLLEHPAVVDVAVSGVDDQRWGEVVAALVVRRHDVMAELTDDELAGSLIEFCGERIARYKTPRVVGFTAVVPRNETGKILRVDVAAELATIRPAATI